MGWTTATPIFLSVQKRPIGSLISVPHAKFWTLNKAMSVQRMIKICQVTIFCAAEIKPPQGLNDAGILFI